MTSQPGLQTIAINILPNLRSKGKGNQTVRFGQVLEWNKINIFFKNYVENESGGLFPGLFSFFEKG